MTVKIFDFSPRQTPRATAIVVSKADAIDSLEVQIRKHFSIPDNYDLRCYKFPYTESVSEELSPREAIQIIPERDDPLDISIKSRTIGEIGLVEPTIGIAVEHKPHDGRWLLEDDTSSDSSVQAPSSSDGPIGRTLGASPNSFTALNRRGSVKSIDDSEDEAPLGMINGKPIAGPVAIPGTYPTSISPRQSIVRTSTDYGERYKSSFNSRFAQPPKEDRVRGTTGLNNLGMSSSFSVVADM
jgi:hypothetical protein